MREDDAAEDGADAVGVLRQQEHLDGGDAFAHGRTLHCRVPMIAAYAPATVSNVACGFDVLGFALDEPGDVVMAAPSDTPGVTILDVVGDGGRLTRDPRKNTAGAAVAALLDHLQTTRGVALTIHKGLPLESGIGSSGASAVAAVVAANELLGRPVGARRAAGVRDGGGAGRLRRRASRQRRTVVTRRLRAGPQRAPAGCRPAAGARRAGLRAAPSRTCRSTPAPRARCWATRVPLKDAVRQWANLGALVAALFTSDRALLSRSLVDVVAEPKRAGLVPGFYDIKAAALDAGALGCSLSGSGPSLFALASSMAVAQEAGAAMQRAFARHSDVGSDLFVSLVGRAGARVVTAS